MDNNYAYKTEKAVLELTEFDVKFCETNQSYLFNYEWTNTCINSNYNEEVDNIKNLLHLQLKTGSNHKVYLGNLISILKKRIHWLEKMNYSSPAFFENYSINTIDVHYNPPVDNSNKINYGNFLNNSTKADSAENVVFWFLELYEKEFNYFKNILDFEKGILLHRLELYKRAISKLQRYIKSIYDNVEFTDFNRLNLENLSELKQTQKQDRICHFNLDKKNVAHFFRLLTEEKIIVFDELNDKNNLFEMKKFVEHNFTYQNTKKERKVIETFNREYSEVSARQGLGDNAKHKAFIDNLILILQTRKNELKDYNRSEFAKKSTFC